MKQKRILLLMHTLGRTGAPKIALDAIEAMPDVTLSVLSTRGGPLRARATARSEQVSVLEDGVPTSFIARLRRRARVRRLLAARFDLIYVNTVVALQLLDWLHMPDAPTLLHVHELDSYLEPAFALNPTLLTERPTRYAAVSAAVRDALVNCFHIDASRIALVPEFIDTGVQPGALQLGTSPVQNGPPWTIGGGGSGDLRKGHSIWLAMAANVARQMGPANVRFIWVGGGDTVMWAMKSLARRLGIVDLVEIIPDTEAPLAYFGRCHVFAQSAWEDPCPVVVLENMMLGVPVVCFANSGGAPEEVGEAGVVVDDFSPGLMADAVVSLLNDPVRRATLAALGKRRVREEFDVSVQVPKLRAAMDQAIAEWRPNR